MGPAWPCVASGPRVYTALQSPRADRARVSPAECSDDNPCEGLSRHATFSNFGMAFLTLFRVSTGDNWNGIMKVAPEPSWGAGRPGRRAGRGWGGGGRGAPQSPALPPQDTLRECAREDKHCLTYLPAISPIYFVTFVLVAQFVLVNVVVAVLMKHLEESNKEAREDAELDAELELEVAQGPPARPRPAAPQSPDAPGLLVVRKVSVSRMLSLPNDSYMFRPVAPASAPHPRPLPESDAETCSGEAPGGGRWEGAAGPPPGGRGCSVLTFLPQVLPWVCPPLHTPCPRSPAPPSGSLRPHHPQPGTPTPSVPCPLGAQPAPPASADCSADR